MGLGRDGLLEQVASNFDDVYCVMHGRTMTTEKLWELNQAIRSDTDIHGAVSEETAERQAWLIEHKYNNPHWRRYQYGVKPRKDDSSVSNWTDMTRHRAYPEDIVPITIYGTQKHYN